MKDIVIYHKNCLDGTCAAWVASQYLPKETTYIAVEYGKPLDRQIAFPPPERTGQAINIYILDWCPEMLDLDKLCKHFGKVILIDHHESAIKKLQEHYTHIIDDGKESGIIGTEWNQPNNLELFLAYDNEWSGAMGTATWFNQQAMNDKEKHPTLYDKYETKESSLENHWLVKAVDDRDRWQFKLPDTKEINEGLFHIGFNLDTWINYCSFNTDQKLGLIMNGTLLIQKKQQDAQAIIQSSAILDVNKEKIVLCNCPPFLASEVGNILAKNYRLAVLWFMDKEGQISVSLRSNSATPDWINCSKIAIALNGGGHANAAGFKMDTSLEEIILALDDAIINTEQSITLY